MSDTQPNSSREWNYHPDLPLADNSIFKWPPKPGFLARWFARNWLTLSERVLMVLVALAFWLWVYPDFNTATTFQAGWITQVWQRSTVTASSNLS